MNTAQHNFTRAIVFSCAGIVIAAARAQDIRWAIGVGAALYLAGGICLGLALFSNKN